MEVSIKSKTVLLENPPNISGLSSNRFGKSIVFAFSIILLAQGLLHAQSYVGEITKPDMFPTAVAVYEKGDKVCIADSSSKKLLIYNATTLQELGSVPIDLPEIHYMVVNETYGKLYACCFDSIQRGVAVVDLEAMSFLYKIELESPGTFPRLAQDEGWEKIYVLFVSLNSNLYQIDAATDAVTKIPDVDAGGIYDTFVVNPLTHEIAIGGWQFGLTFINPTTFEQTVFPDIHCLGICAIPPENKYVLGFPWSSEAKDNICLFDRNSNKIIILPGMINDATEFTYNPSSNRVYSSSEVDNFAAIIEGHSNAYINLPMPGYTMPPEIRFSTNHVYYSSDNFIGVLEDSTQLLEIIPMENPTPNTRSVRNIAINQSTGRVFVIVDWNDLHSVTVLQDEDVLTRPPIYLAVTFSEILLIFDPLSRKELKRGLPGPTFGFPWYGQERAAAMAVNPGGGRLYVPTGGMDNDGLDIFGGLGRLDYFETGGNGSIAVVMMPEGKTAYKTNAASNTVSLIDLVNKSISNIIPVGTKPWGAAVTPMGSQVFVANRGSDTVSVINTSTNTVSKIISVGSKPWGIAVNPSGTKAYVSNSGSGTVTVINIQTGSVIGTVTVGSSPHWLITSPGGDYVFVVNNGSGSVSIIDTGTDTVARTVNVGGQPEGICALPMGGEIYVGVDTNLAIISTTDFSVSSVSLLGAGNQIIAAAVADFTSRFAGRITASGQPSQGVLVRAFQGGIEKGQARSNTSGDYCVFNLKPGTFDLEFSAPGHPPRNLPSQSVQTGRTTIVDMDWDAVTPFIAVVSPNGGEIWNVGSTHNITWTSLGITGNVKIEFSTNNGSSFSTIAASIINTGNYAWIIPNTPSATCLVRVSSASTGIPADTSDSIFSLVTPNEPTIGLSKSKLYFGGSEGILPFKTSDQQFLISNYGEGFLSWNITDDKDWLSYNPATGIGDGVVSVSVNPSGLTEGSYNATLYVSSTNASNSPQTIAVTLTVKDLYACDPPFGSFDTPVDGTTGVTGAIPVTGWVLDDIGIESVKVYRDPVAGENTEDIIYIGDAMFVEGARPDVEQAYPDYPLNYKAGWGYMMLTNFLPGQGNGTYRIHAYATDLDGHTISLGTKTIHCDNANAIKPFGAIDTPTQGGTATGPFFNAGWALTPMPNKIPEDGSTIYVWVDGQRLGNPAYNQYRNDIATLFPGYENSQGAVGAYYLDTTTYTNGVHTIAWSVADNAGNSDGIGSRFFTIANIGGTAQTEIQSYREDLRPLISYESILNMPVNFDSVQYRIGYREDIKPEIARTDEYGLTIIEIREVERVRLDLGKGSQFQGYLVAGEELRPLPVGSSLDTLNGVFYWIPGPGFIGVYDLVFIKIDEFGMQGKIKVKVTIKPKFGRDQTEVFKNSKAKGEITN